MKLLRRLVYFCGFHRQRRPTMCFCNYQHALSGGADPTKSSNPGMKFKHIYFSMKLWPTHLFPKYLLLFVLNWCFDTVWWHSLKKHVFWMSFFCYCPMLLVLHILCQIMTCIHTKFQWQCSSFTYVFTLTYIFTILKLGNRQTQIDSQSWAAQLTSSRYPSGSCCLE